MSSPSIKSSNDCLVSMLSNQSLAKIELQHRVGRTFRKHNRNSMKFENLPNEILFEIFDYLYGTHLIQAFYGLNTRFNLLLYTQYPLYRFWFHKSSKRHFDLICQKHFPHIAHQVLSIYLINCKTTPQQIDLFFSYIPSFRSFTHLQRLRISGINKYKFLLKVLDECQHLCHLTQLELNSCSFQNSVIDFQLIINKIWSLSTLTSLSFHMEIKNDLIFCPPTVISSSLKSLTMFHPRVRWNDIDRLVSYTPQLKHLLAYVTDAPNDNYQQKKLSTLTKCNLTFYDKSIGSKINLIFDAMPNLRHLNVNLPNEFIDGHRWERIIHDYLLNLKIFYLRMQNKFSSRENLQKIFDQMIDSFRTPFWTDERKWFVQCFRSNTTIYLSTVSNMYNNYTDIFPDSWESTCANDSLQEFYNHLTYVYNVHFFNKLIASNICLPNITSLRIELPIKDQFWSVVPNLNRLKTLSILSYADTYHFQVQTLLDRTIHVDQLSIAQHKSLPLQMSLFNIRHSAIHNIVLDACNHYYSEQECLLLTNSSLCAQCEILSIQVTNRECILHLTKHMPKLQSLVIESADDGDDEIVEWLKEHLSSTYLITRDPKSTAKILIWM